MLKAASKLKFVPMRMESTMEVHWKYSSGKLSKASKHSTHLMNVRVNWTSLKWCNLITKLRHTRKNSRFIDSQTLMTARQ